MSVRAISAILLTATLGFWGCSPAENPDTIAVLLPLSGPNAATGEQIRRGVEIEWENLRSGAGEGDFRLEIVDTEGQPGRAAELAQKLVDHGVVALLGGVTHLEAEAIARVAAENDRVFVSLSPSAIPQNKFAFRLLPSTESAAIVLAGFTSRSLDPGRVSMIHSTGPEDKAGVVFAQELERNGQPVAGNVEYGAVMGDLDQLLNSVLSSRPRTVFVSGPSPAVASILEGLEERRFRGTILTPSLLGVESLDSEASKRRRSTLLLGRVPFEASQDDPVMGGFVSRFEEVYEQRPSLYAAYGADAVIVLHAAWHDEAGGSRPEDLWRGLRSLSDLRGVTGYLHFDETGQISAYPRVYRVEGELQTPFPES
jgi:branched-chain amino acid transport system substrate-binding protein